MKPVTFYLPEESEAPKPPEGFAIVGYRTMPLDNIEFDKIEPYNSARYVPMFLEENLRFECVASDKNEYIYCPSDFRNGRYDNNWYNEYGEVFNLEAYKESE